jgi:hypothetical protein
MSPDEMEQVSLPCDNLPLLRSSQRAAYSNEIVLRPGRDLFACRRADFVGRMRWPPLRLFVTNARRESELMMNIS